MWINYNEARVLMAQAGDEQKRIIPGYQRIDDADWEKIRPSVLQKIKAKLIEEVEPKVETDRKGPGGKALPDRYIETAFGELDNDTQETIIKGCLSVEQLSDLKKDAKESVRILILNQIEKLKERPDPKK